MKVVRRLISSWRTFFRGVLYPAGFLAVVGLVVSLFDPLMSHSVQVSYLVFVVVALILLVILIELAFLATNSKISGHKNQDEALRVFGPLADKIGGATKVHLLGTTFKSFSDDEANLKALQQAIASGSDVKILMIHPNGEEISRMLIARQDRNSYVSDELLRNEIRSSISRLQNALGENTCEKIIRFYRSTRSVSIYRIDDGYFVTCYTHGRGGSSPVITYQGSNDGTDEFSATFERGFSELWNAGSTVDFKSVLEDTHPNVGAH